MASTVAFHANGLGSNPGYCSNCDSSSIGRVPGCHPGGCRFKPGLSLKLLKYKKLVVTQYKKEYLAIREYYKNDDIVKNFSLLNMEDKILFSKKIRSVRLDQLKDYLENLFFVKSVKISKKVCLDKRIITLNPFTKGKYRITLEFFDSKLTKCIYLSTTIGGLLTEKWFHRYIKYMTKENIIDKNVTYIYFGQYNVSSGKLIINKKLHNIASLY